MTELHLAVQTYGHLVEAAFANGDDIPDEAGEALHGALASALVGRSEGRLTFEEAGRLVPAIYGLEEATGSRFTEDPSQIAALEKVLDALAEIAALRHIEH